MNVDKFGHYVHKKRKKEIIIECCLKSTNDGNLDAQNKTIKNIASPINCYDCVTKKYVDELENNIKKKIAELNQMLKEITSQLNNTKKGNIKNKTN